MRALAEVHMRNHGLTQKQFLRSAYQWKFSKDISDLSLCNDTKQLVEHGKIPQYLIDYILHIYGVQL